MWLKLYFFQIGRGRLQNVNRKNNECFISNGYAYIQANVHKPKINDIIFRSGVFKAETKYGNIVFTEMFIEPGKSAQKFYIKAFNVLPSQVTLQVSTSDKYFIKIEDP